MRFVILLHTPGPASGRAAHWDLLLDTGAAVRTWALADEPCAGATLRAAPLADHRRVFLTYEGPLSGGRGTVLRWDAGDCDIVADDPQGLVLNLAGTRIRGRVTLRVTAGA